MTAETSAVGAATRVSAVRARATARVPAVLGIAFWIVLPIACLCVLVGGGVTMASKVNNVPAGIQGSFFVTGKTCIGKLCSATTGVFTSDDGRVRRNDLVGPWRFADGQRYRVVYDVGGWAVIPLPAHWDPTPTVVGMAGAGTFLGVWGWCLTGALRRRRSA